MALVLDSPVAADTLVHSGSCHFQCFPAGEDEGVLLADPVAGDLEDLAADAGGLGCMRKIDAVGAGEPAGPFLYPSPAALLHDVVRSSGEQREDLVEYLPLQGWLVSLDGHQVIPSGSGADVFCGFPLGVRGVESDQD